MKQSVSACHNARRHASSIHQTDHLDRSGHVGVGHVDDHSPVESKTVMRVHWKKLVFLMVGMAIIGLFFAYERVYWPRPFDPQRHAVTFLFTVGNAQSTFYSSYNRYCATIADTAHPSEQDYDPRSLQPDPVQWLNPGAEWGECGIRTPSYTHFQYMVSAGGPDDECIPPPLVTVEWDVRFHHDEGDLIEFPACDSVQPGVDWYYAVGRGDMDGDGQYILVGTSSGMVGRHWSLGNEDRGGRWPTLR